jgi:hypothetical protein
MKSYISLIDQILRAGGQIIDCENLNSSFAMNKRASDEKIVKCDLYFNKKLPNDYKYFLRHHDGGILFDYKDLGGYELLGTNKLVKEDEFQKENFAGNGEDWDNNIILFCHLIGNAEFLGFKINETSKYEIVHCIMDEMPNEWLAIGNSFDNLLETIIKEKGKEYWLF